MDAVLSHRQHFIVAMTLLELPPVLGVSLPAGVGSDNWKVGGLCYVFFFFLFLHFPNASTSIAVGGRGSRHLKTGGKGPIKMAAVTWLRAWPAQYFYGTIFHCVGRYLVSYLRQLSTLPFCAITAAMDA